MAFMVAKARTRIREGKETAFLYRGSEVNRKKIERFKKKKSEKELEAVSPSATTPSEISYETPPPESPAHLLHRYENQDNTWLGKETLNLDSTSAVCHRDESGSEKRPRLSWASHLPKMRELYTSQLSIPDIHKAMQCENFEPCLNSVYYKFRSLGLPTDPIGRKRLCESIRYLEGRKGSVAALEALNKGVSYRNLKARESSDQPRSQVRRDSNHSFDHAASPIECINPKSISIARLDENLREQREMVDQADVPLTDSGYHSAPNLNNLPHFQSVFEETARPGNIKSSLAGDHGDDNDTKTLYSLGTTVDPGHARNYIFELSNDIYSKLHQFFEAKNRTMLSMVLPELIKAFAIKIYHDTPTQENRNIMYFIYRRHKEVTAQLEAMLNHEEDDPDRTRDPGDMSLLEKMNMWNSKAGEDCSFVLNEDLFEGVPADDENPIAPSDLTAYHKIVLESTAYKWFLLSLKKES
ncbi:uncharacterized protein PAC_17782 [Phialocephala subalpina]|uniref:Uncharacterized protein n=1 Tax=Phialocephala subalpina TaxID=576137 RepID=A0A1L7XS62_9HELO|nr:uncharacterized protein PAC_17782 [Phialocephala subalpina]